MTQTPSDSTQYHIQFKNDKGVWVTWTSTRRARWAEPLYSLMKHKFSGRETRIVPPAFD